MKEKCPVEQTMQPEQIPKLLIWDHVLFRACYCQTFAKHLAAYISKLMKTRI